MKTLKTISGLLCVVFLLQSLFSPLQELPFSFPNQLSPHSLFITKTQMTSLNSANQRPYEEASLEQADPLFLEKDAIFFALVFFLFESGSGNLKKGLPALY